jgi:hypothetical protein
MAKFFQSEIAAFDGDRNSFQNVKFKKNDFDSTSAAEGGSILEIIPVHYKNPPVIQFIAFVTSFAERFDVKFASEQPFGRTNPYYVWQSNDRSISLGFDVPSSGISNGLHNLNNLSWLLASLYPTYKDSSTATSIAASPIFRLRYANLISSPTNGGQGLLGVIRNVSIQHVPESGFIYVNPKNMGTSFANIAGKTIAGAKFETSVPEGKRFLIPKLIKITMDFGVVHDHALGWDYTTGDHRAGEGRGYPHDFGVVRDASDSPGVGGNLFEVSAGTAPPPRPGTAAAHAAERATTTTLTDLAAGTVTAVTRTGADEPSDAPRGEL